MRKKDKTSYIESKGLQEYIQRRKISSRHREGSADIGSYSLECKVLILEI